MTGDPRQEDPSGEPAGDPTGDPRWDPWRAQRAAYMRRRGGRAWGPRPAYWGPPRRRWAHARGFGCIFALAFLFVVILLISAMAAGASAILARLGVLPAIVILAVVLTALATTGARMARTARTLDDMVDATRRVEGGDYSVRVGQPTGSTLRPLRHLASGFDTMVARLEADEAQRRSLLADVSHELRTPLAVISGNLEAIVDGVYPADEAHLTPILEEARVLGRLIDDLRTMALSEAGTLPLHREPTDPDVIVGDVVAAFRAVAASSGVSLTTEVQGDLPIIDVDPVRIREVLSNLVANALRATPTGGTVAIGASASPTSVVITVRDTGTGIDPALLPHVFERFVKGERSGGSGLGLAIARGLVEAHGGTIAVASGRAGSTFRVELPRG